MLPPSILVPEIDKEVQLGPTPYLPAMEWGSHPSNEKMEASRHLDDKEALLTNWIRTNIKLLSFLVDREWVCRPPHYSPPKINSISSEYVLSFHLSSPMHSQYYSPNHGY